MDSYYVCMLQQQEVRIWTQRDGFRVKDGHKINEGHFEDLWPILGGGAMKFHKISGAGTMFGEAEKL